MLAPYSARLALLLALETPKPRLPFFAELRLPMRVWATDVDYYLHMNNGAYLTLMDLGRYQLALRTGLMGLMLRRNWWPVLGAATIRFRRELRLHQRFELASRLLGWDGKWFYIEQRFLRGTTLHAAAVVRAVMRHRGRNVSFGEISAALGVPPESPPLPDLEHWRAVWDAAADRPSELRG